MTIAKVGVVGCGLMGGGIAQVCALSGYRTLVREVDQELLSVGMDRIRARLERGLERGRLEAEHLEEAWERLTGATTLDALSQCELIIEAATEDLEVKSEIFDVLGRVCSPHTIFASNTSSLSITEMAFRSDRPDRFVGLHFFNPVPVMGLVEVVHTLASDPGVVDRVVEFSRSLGKVPVRAKDSTGFIVNRLLVPYLLQAIRVLDEGLASAEDIDNAMRLGCGHPMGPLALLDFVGLDTTYYIATIMYEEMKEPQFAAPPLLKRMVLAGRLGRKSGHGFYRYESE